MNLTLYRPLLYYALGIVLAACAAKPQPAPDHPEPAAHATAMHPSPSITTQKAKPSLPATPRYSIFVDRAPARELLLALARDAQINIDIHSDIEGIVSLQALRQPLTQILERIAYQAHLRWHLHDGTLYVEPDRPYLAYYHMDYLLSNRHTQGEIAVSSTLGSNNTSKTTNGTSPVNNGS